MKQNREIRIVGNSSEKVQQKTREDYNKKLFDHLGDISEEEKELMKKFELSKTIEQIKLIELANIESNNLMKKFGLEPIEVVPANIHLINSEEMEKAGKNTRDLTLLEKQGIVIGKRKAQENPSYLVGAVFHELLHLKAHISLEQEKNGETNTKETAYRWGVSVYSSQAKNNEDKIKHEHFDGLNEAIVSLQTSKINNVLLNNPLLAKEKLTVDSKKAKDYQKELSLKWGILEEDMIVYGDPEKELSVYASYPMHIKFLRYIIKEIYKDFSEKYKNEDEVFDEFIKANFTGQILSIARLIEKTFGKGSFRSLGEMTSDDKSAVVKMESFKRLRTKMLKENK